MNDQSYKENIKKEYLQLKKRRKQLIDRIREFKAKDFDADFQYNYDVLREQANAMLIYMQCLETRAELEGITL
ncbi:crAss001_48 related protein [Clostridium perfringens]|uniref:crAss001_48 related protein n=1 Tax=Clostridium perfringens TaxID=1502 RepID=UPI0039EC0479